MYYAGIGSRKTPLQILDLMVKVGHLLALKGYFLRSGGAQGADTAFETGAARYRPSSYEIYRPNMTVEISNKGQKSTLEMSEEDKHIASILTFRFHPKASNLPFWTKALMDRNVFQILGMGLQFKDKQVIPSKPSGFVLCWTPDGAQTQDETSRETGGTGQAIRIADAFDIPVYNLQREENLERLNNWITRYHNFVT